MRIQTITFQMGRDFNAIMECEHCGSTQENRSGYNDAYYHEQVIPAMKCKACGKDGVYPLPQPTPGGSDA